MLIYSCYNLDMAFDPIKWQSSIRKWQKIFYAKSDGRPSLSDFARHFGISPQVMSNWDTGKLKKRPEFDLYMRLVPEFGDEVFEALDLPIPSSRQIDDLLALVPEDLQKVIKEVRAEYISELVKKGIYTDSPEARQIVKEAFDKFGLKVTIK